MKPFRKNVAVAIDGGGIRGVMVTRALAILEEHLGQPAHEIFRLTAGTSTGSIISAGIGAGLTGSQMHRLYVQLGDTIFRKTLRSQLWVITKYRYPHEPLEAALKQYLGDKKMGDFWTATPSPEGDLRPTDVVITAFDLVDNRTRFIKPWKPEYAAWPVTKAVLASSSVPTYFPAVEGRYVDGGVGAYANPCYYAAYEARFCLKWDPAETTLISLGTGRSAHGLQPGQANELWPWEWLNPILGAFLKSADDQQVHLVATLFEGLDFRRFQVDMREDIEMDDPGKIPLLTTYGDELGRKIINDETDAAPDFRRVGIPGR
jgi:hypothetical protein